MALTRPHHPPNAVRNLLQKDKIRQLLAEGRHQIVAKGIAQFLADIALCAQGSASMVSLWLHLDSVEWRSNTLVDLTTTKFAADDRISQEIMATKSEAELLEVIDGLYQPKQPLLRKRKISAADTEPTWQNQRSTERAKKGIDKAVIRQLKRPPPSKVLSEGVEDREQPADADIFPFGRVDQNPQNQGVQMGFINGFGEKLSAENEAKPSNKVEAVNRGVDVQDVGANTLVEEGLFIKSDPESPKLSGFPHRARDAVMAESNIDNEVQESGTEVASTPNELNNASHFINLVEGATADSFDSIREEVLQYFKTVQAASNAKAAQIHSQLGESAENRIQALKTYVPNSFSRIPEILWNRYSRKLSKFCQEPGFLELTYMQRLERVMDIFYLPEELIAFGSSDWQRMELAVSICVAIAEMMGNDAESENEEGRQWAHGKLEDILWLKKLGKVLPTTKIVIEIDD